MPQWLLSILLPYVVAPLGLALSALLARWLHSATVIAKVAAKDAGDQDKLDDLEHIIDTAVAQAIAQAGGDVAAAKSPSDVASDALRIFKGLASSRLLADLEAVLHIATGSLWTYLLARFTGRIASGKTLAISSGNSEAFDSLSLAQKRAAVAAFGK